MLANHAKAFWKSEFANSDSLSFPQPITGGRIDSQRSRSTIRERPGSLSARPGHPAKGRKRIFQAKHRKHGYRHDAKKSRHNCYRFERHRSSCNGDQVNQLRGSDNSCYLNELNSFALPLQWPTFVVGPRIRRIRRILCSSRSRGFCPNSISSPTTIIHLSSYFTLTDF